MLGSEKVKIVHCVPQLQRFDVILTTNAANRNNWQSCLRFINCETFTESLRGTAAQRFVFFFISNWLAWEIVDKYSEVIKRESLKIGY